LLRNTLGRLMTKEVPNGDSDPTYVILRKINSSIKKSPKNDTSDTNERNGLLRSSTVKNRLSYDIKLSRYYEILRKYVYSRNR